VEFLKLVANERAHNAPLLEKPENRKISPRMKIVIHITIYCALSRQNFNMWWEFGEVKRWRVLPYYRAGRQRSRLLELFRH
jgi:hypothetical protein